MEVAEAGWRPGYLARPERLSLIEAERVAPFEVRYSSPARGLLTELLSAQAHPSAELRGMASRLGAAA